MNRAPNAEADAVRAAAAPAAPASIVPGRRFIHPLTHAIDEGAPREDTAEEAREADAAYADLQFRLANRGMYFVGLLAMAVVFGGDLVEGLLR